MRGNPKFLEKNRKNITPGAMKVKRATSFRSASGYSSSAAKGGGIIDILRSLIDKKIMPSSEMNMPNGAHGGARGLRNPALPDSEKKRIVFLKKCHLGA